VALYSQLARWCGHLLLGEGDSVPADAPLVAPTDLLVDESILTRESALSR